MCHLQHVNIGVSSPAVEPIHAQSLDNLHHPLRRASPTHSLGLFLGLRVVAALLQAEGVHTMEKAEQASLIEYSARHTYSMGGMSSIWAESSRPCPECRVHRPATGTRRLSTWQPGDR